MFEAEVIEDSVFGERVFVWVVEGLVYVAVADCVPFVLFTVLGTW